MIESLIALFFVTAIVWILCWSAPNVDFAPPTLESNPPDDQDPDFTYQLRRKKPR